MGGELSEKWRDTFFRVLQAHDAAQPLKEAAVAGRLGEWTRHLTRVVVDTCAGLGWRAAAKGHLAEQLPVARNEYLALDVLALPGRGSGRWRFPVAVFELENSATDHRVAYALWKTLCVRASLRVLFAYRRRAGEGAALTVYLAESVVGSMSIGDRMELGGETLLMMGSRSEGETFPYGYFKAWLLDRNTGRFERD